MTFSSVTIRELAQNTTFLAGFGRNSLPNGKALAKMTQDDWINTQYVSLLSLSPLFLTPWLALNGAWSMLLLLNSRTNTLNDQMMGEMLKKIDSIKDCNTAYQEYCLRVIINQYLAMEEELFSVSSLASQLLIAKLSDEILSLQQKWQAIIDYLKHQSKEGHYTNEGRKLFCLIQETINNFSSVISSETKSVSYLSYSNFITIPKNHWWSKLGKTRLAQLHCAILKKDIAEINSSLSYRLSLAKQLSQFDASDLDKPFQCPGHRFNGKTALEMADLQGLGDCSEKLRSIRLTDNFLQLQHDIALFISVLHKKELNQKGWGLFNYHTPAGVLALRKIITNETIPTIINNRKKIRNLALKIEQKIYRFDHSFFRDDLITALYQLGKNLGKSNPETINARKILNQFLSNPSQPAVTSTSVDNSHPINIYP